MASDEERQAEQRRVLAGVADQLIARRLGAPAIFFLESIKPLSFVASQALVFLGPILQALLSMKDYELLAESLEDRENLEWLICRLEEAEENNYRSPAAGAPPDPDGPGQP
ncbi:MAG TPA: hypothetical protein VGM19_04575 [Armatimonadota bacterium]